MRLSSALFFIYCFVNSMGFSQVLWPTMLARRNAWQSGWNKKLSRILRMVRSIFWQGGYNARTLATLKDRAWRGVILVERCRATLNRIHEVMFPSEPRGVGVEEKPSAYGCADGSRRRRPVGIGGCRHIDFGRRRRSYTDGNVPAVGAIPQTTFR